MTKWHCPRCRGTDQNQFGKCAVCWEPSPGPQARFLSLTCFEALYGGAAGGGKSDALLVDAVRYVGRGYGTNYKALLLRREFPDLEKSLIVRSRQLYPILGGVPRNDGKEWRFPGGEVVYFGHAQHERDIEQYQGAEFQFVGFDELTTFTEYQYTYIISRIRSARGVPTRLRAATNPGGVGHDWVFRRFGAWLDPKSAVKAEPGQVLYFVRADDRELVVAKGTAGAAGRTFVPARLEDNKYLSVDGQYERGLAELDKVTRERLRNGDWLIQPSKGAYFKRGYFDFVDVAPADVIDRVRRWDLAATEPKPGRDPDWTVGLKMSKSRDGVYYVEDVTRFRESPHKVEFGIRSTAEMDGQRCRIMIPQDPGQAGKAQVAYYVRSLAGFDVRGLPETGDKVTRAQPVSAQCEARNVKLVRGAWNDDFIRELEAFPEGAHDDQVDAFANAFTALINAKVPAGTSNDAFMDY